MMSNPYSEFIGLDKQSQCMFIDSWPRYEIVKYNKFLKATIMGIRILVGYNGRKNL